MKESAYELTVCVNGRPVREFGQNGQTYIEGRKKQPYTIKFRNNSAQRVLAILSVDGKDVVDGKPATAQSRGYVVPAYQSVEVKGWRTDLDKVSEFVFDDKEISYANQTEGTDINCGVVAVKVIAEKVQPPATLFKKYLAPLKVEEHHHHHHYHGWNDFYRDTTAPMPHMPLVWTSTSSACAEGSLVNSSFSGIEKSATNLKEGHEGLCSTGMLRCCSVVAQTPDFNLGTGWGQEVKDEVTLTSFERGNELATLAIYYTDATGLEKVGIDVSKRPAVTQPLPQAFGGFCKPPNTAS